METMSEKYPAVKGLYNVHCSVMNSSDNVYVCGDKKLLNNSLATLTIPAMRSCLCAGCEIATRAGR